MTRWDERSEDYDRLQWVQKNELLETILQACKLNNKSKLCDVGTGTGILANYLSPSCDSISAIDNSEYMLAKAQEKNHQDNIFYLLMNAEHMSFNSDIFDVVVSRMCFHHIDNTSKAIGECHRILKDNGRAVICEVIPPTDCHNFYINMLKYKEKRHVFSFENMRQLLTNSGFKQVNYTFYRMKQISISNWLNNNNLSKEVQKIIYNLWINSPDYVKKTHNMNIIDDDVFVDWLFMIVTGIKTNR
jgi:ubiquinone/menaquinone biosynthesis C-methylase UbiE